MSSLSLYISNSPCDSVQAMATPEPVIETRWQDRDLGANPACSAAAMSPRMLERAVVGAQGNVLH